VSVIAAAMAASIALPPRASMARPACAASECDVATMSPPKTVGRREGYSAVKFIRRGLVGPRRWGLRKQVALPAKISRRGQGSPTLLPSSLGKIGKVPDLDSVIGEARDDF